MIARRRDERDARDPRPRTRLRCNDLLKCWVANSKSGSSTSSSRGWIELASGIRQRENVREPAYNARCALNLEGESCTSRRCWWHRVMHTWPAYVIHEIVTRATHLRRVKRKEKGHASQMYKRNLLGFWITQRVDLSNFLTISTLRMREIKNVLFF